MHPQGPREPGGKVSVRVSDPHFLYKEALALPLLPMSSLSCCLLSVSTRPPPGACGWGQSAQNVARHCPWAMGSSGQCPGATARVEGAGSSPAYTDPRSGLGRPCRFSAPVSLRVWEWWQYDTLGRRAERMSTEWCPLTLWLQSAGWNPGRGQLGLQWVQELLQPLPEPCHSPAGGSENGRDHCHGNGAILNPTLTQLCGLGSHVSVAARQGGCVPVTRHQRPRRPCPCEQTLGTKVVLSL